MSVAVSVNSRLKTSSQLRVEFSVVRIQKKNNSAVRGLTMSKDFEQTTHAKDKICRCWDFTQMFEVIARLDPVRL